MNNDDFSPRCNTFHSYFRNVFDQRARQFGFKAATLEEFEDWKAELIKRLGKLIGLPRMMATELRTERLESIQCSGYRRDKILLQTERGLWMPLYVLIPDNLRSGEAGPVMIAAHGHRTGGKMAVVGREDIPAVKDNIAEARSNYGVKLVEQGYIVFCPDARGAGENREFAIEGKDDPRWATSSCKDFNNTAISLGQTLIGMQTWDLMRLVDYIETLDYCDPSRIGCCGHSGGGWQTLWLTALDARIRCAIVSGYFHGFRDTILKTNRCGCNFVPGLWEMIDVGDLAALIAPRPLLIESGAFDRLNGERGLVDVTEQLDITRRAYQVHQVEERLVQHIFDDVHRWDGAKMPEFLGRWL